MLIDEIHPRFVKLNQLKCVMVVKIRDAQSIIVFYSIMILAFEIRVLDFVKGISHKSATYILFFFFFIMHLLDGATFTREQLIVWTIQYLKAA